MMGIGIKRRYPAKRKIVSSLCLLESCPSPKNTGVMHYAPWALWSVTKP